MYQNLLSYSFIIVHLGHLRCFAIINTTVVNLCIYFNANCSLQELRQFMLPLTIYPTAHLFLFTFTNTEYFQFFILCSLIKHDSVLLY